MYSCVGSYLRCVSVLFCACMCCSIGVRGRFCPLHKVFLTQLKINLCILAVLTSELKSLVPEKHGLCSCHKCYAVVVFPTSILMIESVKIQLNWDILLALIS